MNREIRFQGKRIDNGEWVEGCLIYDNAQARIATCDIGRYSTDVCECKSFEVYPETVGQYTGCKDKNQVKVFEGNIVKNGDDEYLVFWDEQSLSWSLQNENVIWSMNELFGYEVEVIGKIYDSHELLEATT